MSEQDNGMLNGTFDNQATQQREVWVNGECVAGIRADEIKKGSGSTKYIYQWGYYPDVPGERVGGQHLQPGEAPDHLKTCTVCGKFLRACNGHNEAAPMTGEQVKGYRKLSEAEINAMNRLKTISRDFLRELQDLPETGADPRWLAMAKTDMQRACMAACRAVARPDEDC